MARAQTAKLTEKTQAVYQQVVDQDDKESILGALQHAEQVVAAADSADALRKTLDIESMHLRDVIESKGKLQETIGSLIAGYDSLTNALGGEIDAMKDMTLREKLVSFFSERSARQMRERRVQSAEIDTQLQNLVSQTQSIGSLLADHMEVLNREYSTVQQMLEQQHVQLKQSTDSFEAAERELDEANLVLSERREAMAELTGSDRAAADRELQELVNRANELTETRNTSLSNAQTHELFIENHKIALDSLMRQKAAQRILIDKLRISTENRIIQYAATVESLRTAAQQESAHSINEIGTEVDEATSRTMAAIGTAADRSIVEMLERHTDDVKKRHAQQSEIARADAEFARRFAAVAKQFLEDTYEEPR
ncbi:MAG: hypothetical protein O7G30_13710 [Proteobacteria bacterium]|nr:hypothetical protein [Pseudomonadota bacterium]